MKTNALRVFVVLIALGLAEPASLAAGTASTPAALPGIEQATTRLTMLDQDLDGLRVRIESARTFAPAPPSGMSEELGRARPRVREAVSLVFGLQWRDVEPVLAAAHAIEKKIADLEVQVRTWPTEASQPAPSVGSPGAAGAITGIVTDEVTGSPLANVTVYVSGPVSRTATTDATGRWIVTGLGTGTYYAYTSVVPVGYVSELFNDITCVDYCSWYSGTAIAVSDGAVTSGVNFALARTGSVSGTVTDGTTGQGIAQVLVRLHTGSGWGSYRTATTGSDGGYSFPQVPSGTYFLTTYDNRYLDQLYDGKPCEVSCTVSTGTPVVVVSSANTPDIDFTLQMGGSISGKVTSAATGEPVSGGYVLLYGSSGQPAYADLDSTGSYRFGQLQAGTYYARTDVWGDYANQLYDGILCEPTCTVTTGTQIVVALGQETPNIDFALATF
ncbi:MAG TPA: carboxypeptidase regulatory-like domain-containing protein, partial [Thermoanaerobaculia bacterium]|nr:carboxypeptidase regulatory-like domain-containing protein [Thermoanaerobaculia bacterium]